jgi:hypothetical protein
MTPFRKIITGPPLDRFLQSLEPEDTAIGTRPQLHLTIGNPLSVCTVVLSTRQKVQYAHSFHSPEWNFSGFFLNADSTWVRMYGQYGWYLTGWLVPDVTVCASTTKITHLTENARDYLAILITEMLVTGWNLASIMHAAGIGTWADCNMISAISRSELAVIPQEYEDRFYRLLNFLRISRDEIAGM